MRKTVMIFIVSGLIYGCAVLKNNDSQLLYENINFEFDNCCLATNITGTGRINVYEKYLLVTIDQGTIRINPEFDHEQYKVGDFSMSLGKFVDGRKWDKFNEAEAKLTVDQVIKSLSDSIDISGNSFRIPYSDPDELRDSWIVITSTDQTRRRYNYAHSAGKKQFFGI